MIDSLLRPCAALILLLGAVSIRADGPVKMGVLPPEVVQADVAPDYSQGILRRFGSEPLWPAEAIRGYSERYRFTYHGILIYSLQVRIDRSTSGLVTLRATVLKSGKAIERQNRKLSSREFAQFRKLVDESGLWTIYPEFWLMENPDDICLDGMEAIVEKRTSEGYRFSKGNTSCTSPKGMNLLIDKMAALARLDSGVRWFPWSDRDR